jgi:hypothetical protein
VRILIVGNRDGTNVGGSFERAALELGHEVYLLEARRAVEAPAWVRRFNWHLRGHRPTHLLKFSKQFVEVCTEQKPDVVLTTGLAPVTGSALSKVQALGAVALNYLTDDPWNPTCRSSWFLEALPRYDFIASPRRANSSDLLRHGCREVQYVPFAYDPMLHFTESPASGMEAGKYESDVVFIGGADKERIPFIHALQNAGLNVALFGDYWGKERRTRSQWRGYADIRTLRLATSGAKISLCLVRRANRDGHTMRTFEAAAMGACMLVEDTMEHRDILGMDGGAAIFFMNMNEMVERAKWLLDHPCECLSLRKAAKVLITRGRNTYKDRLIRIMQLVNACEPRSLDGIPSEVRFL